MGHLTRKEWTLPVSVDKLFVSAWRVCYGALDSYKMEQCPN